MPRSASRASRAFRTRGPAGQFTRFILVTSALLLPSLSLLPFGALYLWQHGYVLYWAIGALIVVASVAGLELRLLGRAEHADEGADAVVGRALDAPHHSWSSLELSAWRDVEAVARAIDLSKLESLAGFVDLGNRTVSAVAERMHHGKSDPILQFTLPEVLALMERVSNRLGGVVQSHVPFANHLTLAQLRMAYGWRSSIDMAERLYDVWRVARLANPATAAANEARDRLTRAMLSWGRDRVTRRLAEMYVEEVGRAAMDLYSGRLRVGMGATEGLTSTNTALFDLIEKAPLLVAIAGGSASVRQQLADLLPAIRATLYVGEEGACSAPKLEVVSLDEIEGTSAAVPGEGDILILVTSSPSGQSHLLSSMVRPQESGSQPDSSTPLVIIPVREAESSEQALEIGGALAERVASLVVGRAIVIPFGAEASVVRLAADSVELHQLVRAAIAAAREQRLKRIISGSREAASLSANVLGAVGVAARAIRSLLGRTSRRAS